MEKTESKPANMMSRPDHQAKLRIFSDLKSLLKTGIIQSNLMTAFAGFWLALFFNNWRLQDYWVVLVFMLLGTALVIAGGCVLNNYYDRDIDPIMSRTKQRPTVTGTIPLPIILMLGIVLSISGFAILATISWQSALFGLFGWFVYVVLYTIWSKRRYTLNTAIGSLSGAVPPLIGWTAIDSGVSIMAIALFAIMFVWQTPHFLALAIKKKEEYQAANIPMLPVIYGYNVTKRQILFYVICLFPFPLFLIEIGLAFVVLATLLNAGWLLLAVKGFKKQDTVKWANKLFIYSLFYLMIFFAGVILFTLPAVIFG